MRPIQLTMSAFGSYADCVNIDFSKVNQGVFLITGDTGAGKTTIFDGISYALYGQTSGGRRDGSMMRSQYAANETKTYVELTFLASGQVWKVFRSPEYERESKRKNKDGERTMTKERGNLELYQPDGSLYPGNRQEVNRKLIEILGVDAKQFTQIAMIAQGDFLKLLLAKSDERKEIFSRIFDTQIFRKVQEELRMRSKAEYGKLEDNRKEWIRELQQLECEEQEEKVLLLEQSQKEPDLEKGLDFAKMLCQRDQADYEKEKKEHTRILQQLEEWNRRYSVEKEWYSIWEKREAVEQKLAKLEVERPLREKQKSKLELAQKAEKVMYPYRSYQDASKLVKETENRVQNLEKEIHLQEEKTAEWKEKEQVWNQYMEKLEAKEIPVLERLRQALQQYESLQSHLKEAQKMEREQLRDGANYQKADQNYQQMAAQYEQLYQAYLAQQAGVLAAALKEGMPCPVCGSRQHPEPALLTDHTLTQEAVEHAKKSRDQAENQREIFYKKYLQSAGAFQQEMAVIREQQMQLLKEEHPNEDLAQMQERWSQWESQAKKRLQEGEEKVQKARKEQENAKKICQQALQEEQRKRGQLEETKKQLVTAKVQENEKSEEYQACLREYGFSMQQEFLDAYIEPSLLEKEKQEQERYENTLVQTAKEAQWLKEQSKGKERPDLKTLEETLRQETARQRQQEKVLQKLYSKRETNKQAYRRMVVLGEQREELRKTYQVVNTLSRTANGSLAGTAKIDLESYMQRQYFQKMIRCANHHLKRMASGQFLLKCKSLENLSTQGNAGLDLDVYSLITGKVRDVKTLSGGESFMAALALALGMTDVITQAVGAIHMDTLFIDEGFGSLDEQAREQAIRILQGISGGKRLVGIISHVTELKEEIEQKLVVTKGKTGSKVEWK